LKGSTITFSAPCDFRLPIEVQKIRNPQSAISYYLANRSTTS
jgi:hypothetical protein